MLNILVLNCHWNNRGDESAIRAMVDELLLRYPDAKITLQIFSSKILQFPYKDKIKALDLPYPKRKTKIEFPIVYLTKGKIAIFKETKEYLKLLRDADLVLHGPGGPSIGEIYKQSEFRYLMKLLLANRLGIPYLFYAPSMGPFKSKIRNIIRKKVLSGSELVSVRESISGKHVENLGINKKIYVTMDSAFQHEIDIVENEKKYESYSELREFIKSHHKIVGITITDLKWHPVHKNNPKLAEMIKESFSEIIGYLGKNGYGVIFIPQLFGVQNDKNYMNTFMKENCFMLSDEADCYFQQFLISKLHAVIGLRYHSNIFSAKMGTPFISISYEQKMRGFMQNNDLTEFCVDINELSSNSLIEKYKKLEDEYESYKKLLVRCKKNMSEKSKLTTELVCNYIDTYIIKQKSEE